MKVAILLGSNRVGRQSHKIAYYLETQIMQKGVHADLIDLGAKNKLTPGDTDPFLGMGEDQHAISTRVQQADAMIFVTPEYHGSFSGVLKVTLDNLGTEFYRKPIGVVTVSSGKMGGLSASAQLQHVILSLGAYALPTKLLIPDVQTSFDDSFQITNERTLKSAHKFLDEFFWFSTAIHEKKHKEHQLTLNTPV